MLNKKILLLTLRSDIGGGPKHVLDLSETLLQKHAFQVFIASPITPPFGELFKKTATAHYELPFRRFNFKAFFGLLRFCRVNDIAIVHSHGRGAGIYSRLLKFYGFKIVHTYHGIHRERGIVGRLKIVIDQFLELLTDKLIFVSEDELETAKRYSLGKKTIKSSVINNGIRIVPRSHPLPNKNSIGTLSRLTYQKGVDVLIDKMKHLIKTHPSLGATLQIAGAGEDEPKLKVFVSNEIKLIGETTKPKSFLEDLDVYVSSSRWEGLPLSVLEAMALKIPCVLSNVPGHHTFIASGIALSGETEDEFTGNIYRLTTDVDYSKNLTAKAYDYIVKNHSLDFQVEKTVQVYSSCLEIF